ncbi:MAG: AraC family transcriptional regulator [Gemmatimonadaceae bacterium]
MRLAPLSELTLPGFHVLRGAHAGGTLLPRHTHDDASLCYVFEGRFTEHSAGVTYDCGADTLKLTVAGEAHANRFIAAESHGLRVDIHRAHFADSEAIGQLLGQRLFLQRAGVRGLMARIRAEMDRADDVSPLVVESLLLELLARLAREQLTLSGTLPDWLRRAREMVESLYTTRLTLEGVAREVGVSDTALARAWRREFRTSVGERVRALRVERAAHELQSTEEPLSDIAARCGFYDQSHFTNVFRRHVGLSPARYRARSRGR